MIIKILLILLLFLYVLYKYLTRNFNYWHERNVPYLKPTLLFGNFIKTITLKQSLGESLSIMYKSFNTPYFGAYMLDKPLLIIKDLELIKHVLIKDFSNFPDRYVMSNEKIDPMASNMMFFSKNPQWKYIRNKMTPVFTSGKLKKMFCLIKEMGNDMTSYLKLNFDNQVVEAKEICGKFSTNVITSCAFGLYAQSFQDHNAPFRKYARLVFDSHLRNGFNQGCYFVAHGLVKLLNLPFLRPSITTFMRETFWKSIEQRECSKEIRHDVIDIIKDFKDKPNVNDVLTFEGDRIVAQATQFFVAGFETVSSTMSFALYELSINPDVQDRLRSEIKDKIAQYEQINYECVQSMTYLNMVLDETLRKYPVLPFIDRICVDDYKVPNSDLIILKGTPVFVSILGLQSDPRYYPNPQEFIPERFSKINKGNIFPFTYLPFGDGPRNCIGARFGILTTKIGLIEIISNFEVKPCPTTPKIIKFSTKTFLLSSDIGIPLHFRRLP